MMHQTDCTTKHNSKLKTKYRSLALFSNGADLPLFTQSLDVVVAPGAEVLKPQGQSVYIQLSLFDCEVTI